MKNYARIPMRARAAYSCGKINRDAMMRMGLFKPEVLDQHGIEYAEKTLCILISDQSDIGNVAPCPIDEKNAGRAEQLEAFEQCRIVGRTRGYVHLQQYHVFQSRLHFRIGESEALHFLA